MVYGVSHYESGRGVAQMKYTILLQLPMSRLWIVCTADCSLKIFFCECINYILCIIYNTMDIQLKY